MGLELEKKVIEPVPSASDIPDIHDVVKTIIYSFVNVKANIAVQKSAYFSKDPSTGLEMLEFFRDDFSFFLTRDFISYLVAGLKKAIEAIQGQNPSINAQIRCQTLNHLLLAHLQAFKCVRLSPQEILTQE